MTSTNSNIANLLATAKDAFKACKARENFPCPSGKELELWGDDISNMPFSAIYALQSKAKRCPRNRDKSCPTAHLLEHATNIAALEYVDGNRT